jgi:uncharacterized RDD family membrane protein YckC
MSRAPLEREAGAVGRLLVRIVVGMLVAVLTAIVLMAALVLVANLLGGGLPGGVELSIIWVVAIVAGTVAARRMP